jgi:hypothetical protein
MLGVLVVGGVVLLLTITVLELLVGCGEKVYRSDGTWMTGECLFVHHEVTYGRWK